MDLFKLKNRVKKVKENEQTTTPDSKAIEIDNKKNDEAQETTLSYSEKMKIPAEDKYIYQFYHNELDPLKPNQLSVAAVESDKTAVSLTVKALIRHTIDKTIELGETQILLLNQSHKIIAEKKVDLSKMGQLPAFTARPWLFHFKKHEIEGFADLRTEDLSLAFRVKHRHQLELDEGWKQALSEQQVTKLEKIVGNAPKLKPGELNLMALEAKEVDEGTIAVTLLIRNGSEKAIQMDQIPLRLYDKNKQVVAEGGFKLNQFSVNPNTSKPKTFVFNQATIKTSNYDLSVFSVEAIQNK